MLVSIIVPTYNHLEDCLKSCIESIIKSTNFNNVELIVSANGCTDGTQEYVKSLKAKNIILVDNPAPLGFSKAVNEGLKVSTGEYVVLFNNDCILLSQNKNYWLDLLRAPFLHNPKVGITGPLTLHDPHTNYDFVVFFCAMIKRELLNTIGYLDESYGVGYGEDIAYCIEAQNKGYEIVLVPEGETVSYGLMNVCKFPIYHKGEGTVVDDPEKWEQIKKENIAKNVKKYSKADFSYLKEQDPFTFMEIFISNVYEIKPADIKDKIIIDVGANRGFFSLLCESYGAKKILAFEAQPTIYKQLVENVTNHNIITPFNFAITDKSGEKVLIENRGGGSSIYSSAHSGEEVTTATLEDFLKDTDEKVVLKIDVEGAEYDILLSLPDEVYKKVSALYVEIHSEMHPKYKGEELIFKHLRKKGFICSALKHILLHGEKDGKKFTFTPPIRNFKAVPQKEDILAVIPTRGRYNTTLSLAIQSVAMQTKLPDKLLIWDDNTPENRIDLRTILVYQKLFDLLTNKGVQWEVVFGNGKGMGYGEQHANKSKFKYVWRIDDDTVATPTVLEKLCNLITDTKVGAVAGSIIEPNSIKGKGNSELKNIYSAPNLQWFSTPSSEITEVEHLYSSFLYRAGIVDYDLRLSPVSHREDTIFSHRLKREGFKLLVDTSIITYHLRDSQGGIRSEKDSSMFVWDEGIFLINLSEWGYKLIVLNNGLGDHLVLKGLLPELRKKYKHLILSVCYPEVFKDETDITLISIGDAERHVRDTQSIYKWMGDHNWTGHIIDAYRTMLEVCNDYN